MPVQTTPDRTPEGWGRVAEAFDHDIAPALAQYANDLLDATDLRQGERVLDVAAGSGALALAAAARGALVTAIDFAPEMIERLQAKDPDIDARVMDGMALELPDNAFDAVYSNMGVMFFPSPDKGLREMRRVLRPNGRVGLVTWNKPEHSETFSTMFDALHEAAPDLPPPPETPAAFSLADPEDLARRMTRAGFHDVQVRQVRRPFTADSGADMWDAFIRSNPVMPQIMANVDAEKVKAAFVRRVGTGPVSLMGEAHVATGRA